MYQIGFIRETDITQDTHIIRLAHSGQPQSHEGSVQKVSARWRPKGPAQGLELTAVSCASPYQEADGSVMEHWRIYDGRLKSPRQKLNDLCQKPEDVQAEGEDWSSSFTYYYMQAAPLGWV